MIKREFRELITKLNEKTQQGLLVWNKTSSNDQFKLILESATFVVTYAETYTRESLVSVELYDKKGESATIAYEEKGNDDYKLLLRFYENIKSDYMQIPQTISSVLDELNAEEKVGKVEFKSDDLPF